MTSNVRIDTSAPLERVIRSIVEHMQPSPSFHGIPATTCSEAMPTKTNDELIKSAESVLNPRTVGGRLVGDVASSVVTNRGNVYSGVCIDTGSGTSFCAEHSAISAMVTAGEYGIEKIVAVWKDNDGTLYVVPPCGRCREFIRQIDQGNLDTGVILGIDKVLKLRELLPYNEWPDPLG